MEKAEAHFVECGITAIVKYYTVFAFLTDNAGNGATLDPEGSTIVSIGSDLDFTITNPGGDNVYVAIDGGDAEYIDSSNPTEYTLENIQADHSLLFTTEEGLPA
jgi:hypothetical protein